MTQLALANRVQEWATNIGAGALALQGASSPGLRSFATGGLDGKTVPYVIQHRTSNQWECGYGLFTAPGTLTRLVVLSNSAGTFVPINFAAGIVDVGNEQLAERILTLAADLSLTAPGDFGFVGTLTMGGHTYTPPAALPAADGYALVATAAGVMSWAPNSGGGGGGGGALLTFGANLTGGSYDGSTAKTIAVSSTPSFTSASVTTQLNVGPVAPAPAVLSPYGFTLSAQTGAAAAYGLLSGYGVGVGFTFARSNGTQAAPTAVATSNNLGVLIGTGYDGVAWSSTAWQVLAAATESWTAGGHGTQLLFRTTPVGTTSLQSTLTLDPAGSTFLSTVTAPTFTGALTGSATLTALGVTGLSSLAAVTATTGHYTGALQVDGAITGSLANALTPGAHLSGSSYNNSGAVTWTTDATAAATASTIVARDANGHAAWGNTTPPVGAPSVTGNIMAVTGAAGNVGYQVSSFGRTPIFQAVYTGGTAGAPTAVANGSPLFVAAVAGYDGTNYNGSVFMRFRSLENWTNTAHGAAVDFVGTLTGTLTALQFLILNSDGAGAATFPNTVNATTFSGALTGNASTATKWATARNVNGVALDGTADITVAAAAGTLTGATLASNVLASSLTSVGTLTSLNVSGLSSLAAITGTNVTATGLVQTAASAAGGAGLNLPHGAAPTSPVNGDTWTTTAAKFVRINGVTQQLVPTTVTTLSSLASVGTIATGVWQGTVVGATYGGTGVNNGASTITLGGSLTTSGAFALTLTTTAATNVTLPTSGTLVNSAVTTLSSLTAIGTLSTLAVSGVTTLHGVAYTWPAADAGTSGFVLSSNGAGTLSWVANGSGGAAAAGTLTGTTLAANVVSSSLTSTGILASTHLTSPVIDSGGLTITSGTLAAQALTATTISPTGLLLTAASASGGAGLRLPAGTFPTSPTNGDLAYDGAFKSQALGQSFSHPEAAWSNFSGASTSSTGEVSLKSVTIPAAKLAVGDWVRIFVLYKKTGTTNVASGYVKFGATKIWDGGGTIGSTDVSVWVEINLLVEGSSAQRASAFGRTAGGGSSAAASIVTAAEAISGSITLDFRGNVANAADSIAIQGYNVTIYKAIN